MFFIFSISNFANSGDWTGPVKVKKVYVLNKNLTLVTLSSFNNPENCKLDTDAHVLFNTTEQNYFYSMALTAYTSNSDVNIYFGGCQSIWGGAYSFGKVQHFKLI